ncbi:peroxidase 39-like [Actinidia eriantha]|uniref:peroxidase 39-like n=1 Tax=Actinidia eriantha TaxID=165200 RepID=UPI0025863567|nr:peroxidase 39-like [Actinidia eriantha]
MHLGKVRDRVFGTDDPSPICRFRSILVNHTSMGKRSISATEPNIFDNGGNASVLLNFTTASGNQTEKISIQNQTVRGFDFIDRVKSLPEATCPGIVSCADIVALVARDSIVATVLTQLGFPFVHPYTTSLGVGDEKPSLDSEYAANLRSRKCKSVNDNTTIFEMDPGSFRTFDLS